jgi:protein-tyrosine-phosphatase
MKTLLVLCTGNIYRSPLVAALVQQRLAAANLAGAVEVISAGIFAIDGAPADPYGRHRFARARDRHRPPPRTHCHHR